MRPRSVAAGLGAGIVAVAIAIAVLQRDESTDAAQTDAVLPGLRANVNGVTEIRIRKGDGTRTTLRRTSQGWLVAERDYAADTGKVRRLLLDAAALEVSEPKTSDKSRYAVLGVEDVSTPAASGTAVEWIAGERSWGLIVGKASGTREVYVRAIGQPRSALATPQLSVEAAPARWLDPLLLDLRADRVQRLRARIGNAREYVAQRAAASEANLALTPMPRGRRLTAENAATGLASALAGLQLDDVRPVTSADAPRPRVPAATLDVETFDGLRLALAGYTEDARRFVSIKASTRAGAGKDVLAEAERLNRRATGREFEIADYKYAALFRPLEDFLAPLNASSPGA